MSAPRLRVAIATPLTPAHCELLTSLEPRLDLLVDQSLLPPMRWPGDHEGDPGFRRTAEQQQRFVEMCTSADALYGIPDTNPTLLAEVVRANPGLRWVHTMAAGGGSQIKAAGLTEDELDRLEITTSAGPHARPLAEFALFGALSGLKDLTRLQQQKAAQNWSTRWMMGQLFDSVVVVVGMGHIGRATAELFSRCGAQVIGVNRTIRECEGVTETVGIDDLPTVIARADILVNTLPQALDTAGVISAEVLAAARPGLVVVSVGRGSCIDEAALVTALRSGQVGFAALDVFAVEPLPQDSPLWGLDNVVIAPHTAALYKDEDQSIATLFAHNATRLLDGSPLENTINRVFFY